jgi:saposin
MVKQARDQLESNETMGEIRDVFEGSCNLIPIKVVAKECRNLADNFIPELVEALASQMNPQVSVNSI